MTPLRIKQAIGKFAAPLSHNHSASDVTSGTLPIARGGTGATTAAAARTGLGITPANIGAATTAQFTALQTAVDGKQDSLTPQQVVNIDSVPTKLNKNLGAGLAGQILIVGENGDVITTDTIDGGGGDPGDGSGGGASGGLTYYNTIVFGESTMPGLGGAGDIPNILAGQLGWHFEPTELDLLDEPNDSKGMLLSITHQSNNPNPGSGEPLLFTSFPVHIYIPFNKGFYYNHHDATHGYFIQEVLEIIEGSNIGLTVEFVAQDDHGHGFTGLHIYLSEYGSEYSYQPDQAIYVNMFLVK